MDGFARQDGDFPTESTAIPRCSEKPQCGGRGACQSAPRPRDKYASGSRLPDSFR